MITGAVVGATGGRYSRFGSVVVGRGAGVVVVVGTGLQQTPTPPKGF